MVVGCLAFGLLKQVGLNKCSHQRDEIVYATVLLGEVVADEIDGVHGLIYGE